MYLDAVNNSVNLSLKLNSLSIVDKSRNINIENELKNKISILLINDKKTVH